MNDLPENIRRAMLRQPVFAPYAPPARVLTEVVKTPDDKPAQTKWQAGEEKELSRLVVADLRRRGCIVVLSRTDRPTGQDRGVPDLIVMFGPKVCCIELKAGTGKLSAVQRAYHDRLLVAGVPVVTAWTFDEAVKFACVCLDC